MNKANTQPANVEWVFVAGRALTRDGRIVGDQDRVIADAQAASDRVQNSWRRDAHPAPDELPSGQRAIKGNAARTR